MKVLIPFTCYPSTVDGVGAANRIFSNILDELSKKHDWTFILLPINFTEKPTILTKNETICKRLLKKRKNIKFLNEIKMKQKKKNRSFFSRILVPKLSDFFPVYNIKNKSINILKEIDPDLVLVIWDEKLTDLFNFNNYKLYAYYGDPLIKNLKMILQNSQRSFLKRIKDIYILSNLEKQHIAEFKKNFIMSNNSLIDSNYYSQNGVNCKYIQNNWKPDFSKKKIKDIIVKRNPKIVKIVANVGLLSGTANNSGLNFLANHILPKLKSKNILSKFEINVFGGGIMENDLFDKLKYFNVNIRGFIKDLDSEMLDSDIFLCCNNFTKYNVGHTRFLHAWSLGMCVIASSNISKVMPEFEHKRNCLLAKDSSHAVILILKAAKDKELRNKVGLSGYDTLLKEFSPKIVVSNLISQIDENIN